MNKKQQFIEKSLKKFDKEFGFYTRNMQGTELCDENKEIKDFLQSALSECWDMAEEEKTIELCDCACHSFYWPKTRRNKNHGCCGVEYKNRIKHSLTSQKEEGK